MTREESDNLAIKVFNWHDIPIISIPRSTKLSLIGQAYLDLQFEFNKLYESFENSKITKQIKALENKITWERDFCAIISKISYEWLLSQIDDVYINNESDIKERAELKNKIDELDGILSDHKIRDPIQERIDDYIMNEEPIAEINRLNNELQHANQEVRELNDKLDKMEKIYKDITPLQEYFL